MVRAILIEGGLLGIALLWTYVRHLSWPSTLRLMFSSCYTGIGAGLVLLAMNYLVIEYGARYLSFFRVIKQLVEEDVAPLFQNLHIGSIALLAILSGSVEEIFFRGVLQAETGFLLASLIFGFTHIWKTKAILYGVYATVIGVYLGGLYLITGNLWAPMIAHGLNNFVTILLYRYSASLKAKQVIISEEEVSL
jgi:membrane protease YdiL (CAAX protease family)